MGWAGEQFRRDLGIPEPVDYTPLNNTKKNIETKKEDLEKHIIKIEEDNQPISRIEQEQGVVSWKYFDDNVPQVRQSLKDCIQSLIDAGYHVDNVIPTGNYQKNGSTTILITEALIIISQ